MKRIIVFLLVLVSLLSLASCSDADLASSNLSTAADNFEIDRRVVFYNWVTGEYILVIEGKCSIGNNDTAGKVSITCKTGDGKYKKHYLGLSDNVTFFAEQLESVGVSTYRYRVIFKPSAIIPDIEIK